MNAVKTITGTALVLATMAYAAAPASPVKAGGPAKAEKGVDVIVDDSFFYPGEPLASNEMRISFMGSSFLPRIAQAANSVFVECGTNETFVFDCGAGVIAKYVAMGVAYSRMTKIFLTHLHADHMSDLMFIYCFGPSVDRLTDLHVWGPTGPTNGESVVDLCGFTKAASKWHTESFSFLSTGLTNGQDAYTIVPHECIYSNEGAVAYSSNGVQITHFPAIHDRDGAISYRLEWQGISMVFSGDSRPNYFMLRNATNLDVLVHELTLSPEVWATKNSGLHPGDPGYSNAVATATEIQDCSHTPAKAFGYICNQLSNAAPRLAVATHFQNNDDTIGQVLSDIRSWYSGPVSLATDLMVVNISADKSKPIRVRRAVVSDVAWYTRSASYPPGEVAQPRYTNNMMQLNAYLQSQIIPELLYTNTP
jgi:ribonuclease Z